MGKGGTNISWLCRLILLGIRILETLKNDKYDPKASSSSPEVLSGQISQDKMLTAKQQRFFQKIFQA